jgi:hypothetical protein
MELGMLSYPSQITTATPTSIQFSLTQINLTLVVNQNGILIVVMAEEVGGDDNEVLKE